MNRRFGLGDGIVLGGCVVYLVFMIVLLGYRLAGVGFDITSFGQLVMVLLVGMPVAALLASYRDTEYLLLIYAFAGFVLLLRLARVTVLAPAGNAPVGLDFFIMTGALAVGIGAFLVQVRTRKAQDRKTDDLTRLKDQGLITPEEYDRKRNESPNTPS